MTQTDPFSAEQRVGLLRLVDALRGAVEASTSVVASSADLAALADRAATLALDLQALAGTERSLPRFALPFDPGDPAAMIPFSPTTGAFNPIAPPFALHVEERDGAPPKVVGRVNFGRVFEGPPNAVHGGVVAAAWDQVLALANLANCTGGPTASLTVTYRKPTPLGRDLVFEAWVDRVEGRKVWVQGRCLSDGDVVTECEGLFINLAARREARGATAND